MGTADLLNYLQSRSGSYLRGAVQYDDGENDVLYLRGDVREERMLSEIDRMLARLKPESLAAEERSFPLGELYVTVRRFETAIIMHFPRGKQRGIVVSLEPDAARNLNQFTTECIQQIDN
ncbi:hypothetical protein [Haloprofundus salinisoli]|uniref:hypothetical protein n=1 Tax=Haloprofundus salinisoli TaxID=2876193 RepID=UPI001CCF4CF9|nr:hypothetical protein [Haloprofundus salinisoli]